VIFKKGDPYYLCQVRPRHDGRPLVPPVIKTGVIVRSDEETVTYQPDGGHIAIRITREEFEADRCPTLEGALRVGMAQLQEIQRESQIVSDLAVRGMQEIKQMLGARYDVW
jgi:hypothetical protein